MAIERAGTALVCMDFQNDIVDEKGAAGRHGMAAQVKAANAIANTQRAQAAARAAGLMLVHVGVAFRPGHPEIAPEDKFFGSVRKTNGMVEGSWGAAFHPEVAPLAGEAIVIKRGMSSFVGTDLARLLAARRIRTLALAGIATTFVMESTARHAVDLGYNVLTLSDCCASFNRAMHEASLAVLRLLGAAMTAAEFEAALR
ncbi:MAG: cysteine hydrolase [Alphaproteobacteria bacterium]|nr:cysteine hydrolase [Alphaproteobacteria bacterium]